MAATDSEVDEGRHESERRLVSPLGVTIGIRVESWLLPPVDFEGVHTVGYSRKSDDDLVASTYEMQVTFSLPTATPTTQPALPAPLSVVHAHGDIECSLGKCYAPGWR